MGYLSPARALRRLLCLALTLLLAGLFAGSLPAQALAQPPAAAAPCLLLPVGPQAALMQVKAQLTQRLSGRDSSGQAQQQAAPSFAPVELLLQTPELPNGCEVTSLAMVLNAAGFAVDKLTLYRSHLPSQAFTYDSSGQRCGPDPAAAFAGDAADSQTGWYCLEGPVVQAANSLLRQRGSSLRATALTGLSQSTLERYAAAEIPLVVWVTQEYRAPTYNTAFTWLLPNGKPYVPYNNLHCVVLAGLTEGGQCLIADPLRGWQEVSPSRFWASFSAMGQRAVALQ